MDRYVVGLFGRESTTSVTTVLSNVTRMVSFPDYLQCPVTIRNKGMVLHYIIETR